jgi:hypothetical protein
MAPHSGPATDIKIEDDALPGTKPFAERTEAEKLAWYREHYKFRDKHGISEQTSPCDLTGEWYRKIHGRRKLG